MRLTGIYLGMINNIFSYSNKSRGYRSATLANKTVRLDAT